MAQLAPVVDNLDAVPEPARQFYVQKDGKYHVDLNGTPAGFVSAAELAQANGKVVEFRDTNVRLLQEVEQLRPIKAKVEGIDIDAAKTALAEKAELAKKGIKNADDVSNIVKAAVDAAVAPLTTQITAITQTAQEAQKRADAGTLRAAIQETFTKAGGVPEALDFIVNKASGVFIVDCGTVKAAATQFSTDKPGEPLSMAEWMTQLTKQASFAFKPSGGGGANPQNPTNPIIDRPANQTVIRNPTPQQIGQYSADVKAGKVRFEYDDK